MGEIEQNSVNERIKFLVQYFSNGNKSAFAKQVGISNQSLGEIIGARQSAPSFAALQKMCIAFPQVRIEWLVLGEGLMLKTDPVQSASLTKRVATPEELQEIAKQVVAAHMANKQMRDEIKKVLAKAEAEAKAAQDSLMKVYAVGEGYHYPYGPDSKLSARLGITDEEALRLVLSGKIRAVDVGEEGYRITERAVREYLGEEDKMV